MNRNGVDDLILLETINEQSIVDTLKFRYDADLIYTNIGQVLIAVNPYRQIPTLYGPSVIKNYQNRYFFEEPPHVYAIAEHAYHSLLTEGINQCIIITGESGAGKTETSKLIMQYIAAVTGKGSQVQKVKEQILESNPVLEAFGNAKTVQNNNSSRFGKYFQIQFNYEGDPTGGRITNYLLEKSRVITQARDERNFHIFYQLLTSPEKNQYQLTNLKDYRYLNQSGCFNVEGINDSEEWKHTKHGMTVIGISEENQKNIFQLLAAILHLGNITFAPKGKDIEVAVKKDLTLISNLMGIESSILQIALCNRSVSRGGARSSNYLVPLKIEEAIFSRDALAKAIYSRIFDWLVEAINKSMCDNTSEFNIGVLDIYGFEIFRLNSFEQLCINYVNEKLQQIFIELTLKSEQEEYVKEKISWESVSYFNNQPCVELIEKKNGIFALLDEECLFPNGSDQSFLDKLHKNCKGNPHYVISSNNQEAKVNFSIIHYAGQVSYNKDGFLDKNRDTLFKNVKEMLQSTNNPFMQQLYPVEVSSNLKRPPTSVAQFKNQVCALVDTLMACTPHYIRCIRPNGKKQSRNFDLAMSTSQVRYLGLLENVRVRRAGYVYRNSYERFLQRFKLLSPLTWPKWQGLPKDGCITIMKESNIDSSEYELGISKIFIKKPQTLFTVEELRQRKISDIATIIQRKWRAHRGRAFYKKVTYASGEIFNSKKERRVDSVFRPFQGDYIKFKGSRISRGINKKFNEKKIMFADQVSKVNHKLNFQTRTLVITDIALYNIGGIISSIQRRILIKNITAISLSSMQDNFFILHVPTEYDYIIESKKKTEIVTVLCELIKDAVGNRPQINFSDNIQYKTSNGKMKTIQFIKDESIKESKWKKQGEILIVSVASGLDKSAGRKARTVTKTVRNIQQINKSSGKSK